MAATQFKNCKVRLYTTCMDQPFNCTVLDVFEELDHIYYKAKPLEGNETLYIDVDSVSIIEVIEKQNNLTLLRTE